MNTMVSPRLSRLLALALLLAVLAVPYLAIVRPFIAELAANRETLAEQATLLERYSRLAAAGEGLGERLDASRRQPVDENVYLEGASEALVAAELQNRVKIAVQSNGGTLNSTQILEPTAEAGFRRLAVRARMSAGTDALPKVLHALEAGRPFLFIDNVDINARTFRRRNSAGTGETESVELIASFDLFGYMRPGST